MSKKPIIKDSKVGTVQFTGLDKVVAAARFINVMRETAGCTYEELVLMLSPKAIKRYLEIGEEK